MPFDQRGQMVPVYSPSNVSDLQTLESWWQRFQESHNYPLYGIILATSADTEVAVFIEDYMQELDELSGDDCCFIYFRDLSRAKQLLSFNFSEHVRYVLTLTKILDISLGELPSILFFRQIGTGDYINISLANLSDQEINALVRQIFVHLRNKKPKSSSLAQMKRFKGARHMRVTSQKLLHNVTEIGKGVLDHILGAIIDTYLKPF